MDGATADLEAQLGEINRLRRSSDEAERDRIEGQLDRRFAVSHRLAVYGTLAPGRSNHYLLQDLGGQWREGTVHGALEDVGWGAVEGYPAMRWQPRGESEVRVHLLVSPELPRHWERLDVFEGESYVRILVTVHLDDGGMEIANLYEAR